MIAPFAILVCGGRAFADVRLVFATLDCLAAVLGALIVIEGGASGADAIARNWAARRGHVGKTFPADWRRHGRAAGPLRNQQMLDEGRPDVVVAFPGGAGTADMVRRARLAGVRVVEKMRDAA